MVTVLGIGIAGEAGYNGNLTGVRKKCTLYKYSHVEVDWRVSHG